MQPTITKSLFRILAGVLLFFMSSNVLTAQNNSNVDFKQAANKDPILGDVHWINSIVHSPNSVYYEGMAVPQRILLNDIQPGTHTLAIRHQSIKNSSNTHAYDFLTSWDQAKQAAQEIYPANPLLAQLFAMQCGTDIPGDFPAACANRTFSAAVAIPAPPNPAPTFGTGTVAAKKAAFDAHFSGQNDLMIYAGSAITAVSLTFSTYDGTDQDAEYLLTWTSSATNAVIEFAGHLASGNDFFDSNIGWSLGKGCGGISGAPYHISLTSLDDNSIGSQDNQVKDIDIRICTLTAGTEATNVTCNGADNGIINAIAGQGTPPYMYSIDGTNFQAGTSFTGLAPGTYTVTIKDANLCFATSTVIITEPDELSASNTSVNVSCNGGSNGSIDLTVSGGTTPYSYLWSNTATTEDLSGLSAGTYSVTVTDANGCTVSKTVEITEPTVLSGEITGTNVTCFDLKNGSANLSVSGGTPGYTYSWDNGTTTEDLTAIGAGTYSVTVTDANGCQVIRSIIITQPDLLKVSVSAKTNIICKGENNGSVTVAATGGTSPYSYSIDGGSYQSSATFSGLAAGNYTISVKDKNNCTAGLQVTIEDGPVCYPYYTYTQGYYGNTGGKSCVRESGQKTTAEIMLMSLSNGGPMVLGNTGAVKSFTVYATAADVSNLIKILPSGGPAAVLAKNHNLLATANYPPLQNGKIRNILLGQTTTLWLNTHIPGNVLGSLDLIGANNKNYIVTIAVNTNAQCTAPYRAVCSSDASAVQSFLFPQDVINALVTRNQGTTVNDLLKFASDVLGGGSLYGTSLSSLTAATDAINNAFDKGRYFDKFSATAVSCLAGRGIATSPEITIVPVVVETSETASRNAVTNEAAIKEASVSAYPNPFKGQVNFSIASPESGRAKLELYDAFGRYIATVFEGSINAGIRISASYSAKSTGMFIYKFYLNGRIITGKVQGN